MESLESALALLMEHASPVSRREAVPLENALGRVLAEDVFAPIALPPFDRSALDGYTFRAEDVKEACAENPASLRVVGEILAGCGDELAIGPGQAVRIMTGGQIPEGCNCVIRQEDVTEQDGFVCIPKTFQQGQNICRAGEDVQKGEPVARRGERITAIHAGVLGGLGVTAVAVYARVTAALLCTGDELIPAGTPLTRGKIYNTNQAMLQARLMELGVTPLVLTPGKDDAQEVAIHLLQVLPRVDMILTTGGVSVGKKDILHDVLKLLNAKRLFWRIAMKPGSPLLAGLYEDKLLICLSGNPFAAIACFELFAKPVLMRMSGDTAPVNRRLQVPLNGCFAKASPSRRLIRAVYDGQKVTADERNHSSGSLCSMIGCNCLIDIPAGDDGLQSGDIVEIVLL